MPTMNSSRGVTPIAQIGRALSSKPVAKKRLVALRRSSAASGHAHSAKISTQSASSSGALPAGSSW